MVLLPLPVAAAVAQPWWDERARRTEWERYRQEERRRRLMRREAFDDRREHEIWERRRRVEARREWEVAHGPYRP